MIKSFSYYLLFSLLSPLTIFSQYEITNNCKQAWEAIIDLRFESADSIINNELSSNPDNYYAYYLMQMGEAYALLIDQSVEGYEQFSDNYKKRVEYLEDKDSESPYYLSCLAEMQLQMGIFNILFENKFKGLRNCYGSYKKTFKNLKINPDYKESKKLKGIFYVAIANLPPFVSWAANAFGVEGDYKRGYRILDHFYENYSNTNGLAQEAALCNILTFKLNKDPKSAYDFIAKLDSSYFNYNLIEYFHSNIYYLNGYNETALNILNKSSLDSTQTYFNGYNYLMGKILLRKLDSSSIIYFTEYLNNNHYKQYVKEINYKMALAYLVQGDLNKYNLYLNYAKTNGEEITERDRETAYDINIDYIPNITLLKADLQIKGGYFDQAIIYLNSFDISENNFLPYELKYLLLNGIYYYNTNEHEKAIYYFKKVVDKGSNYDYYFADEAAMYLGMIYENTDRNLSKKYYEIAIDLYQSNYYEYIIDFSRKKLEYDFND